MNLLYKASKIILYLFALIILAISILLIYSTITFYRPKDIEVIASNEKSTLIDINDDISVITWNIGYAGLGDDMDFFYDGGKKTRTSLERTKSNHNNIFKYLSDHSYNDFFLLQEVDIKSKRSYYVNTYDSLISVFPNASHSFGINYKAKHVPVPIFNPMGAVTSGIVTISNAIPSSAERYSYPSSHSWPVKLFHLQRCFLINRYNVSDGKELVIVHTHNSAHDDGSIKALEMEVLKEVLIKEFEKGNYIIAGGDWNQSPPDFKPDFIFNLFDTINIAKIPTDFLPDWQWVYSSEVPTNRTISTPYNPGESLTTVVDFFLISPNIELKNIECIHLDFKNSDHNPVKAKFKLGKTE